ncbi:WD domain, G-beta repeat, putative [Angomonas deanei]|uniref:WD domain, G-beta repeat, putative n=1 Tax=Angomonas deanei TaxID=59799 RepID=A0A7G2CNK2_9TRYP|nr:WD domain, G-beta repeat, putative [Angomonas deanei]
MSDYPSTKKKATGKKSTPKKGAKKSTKKKGGSPPRTTRNLSAVVADNQITSDSISVTSKFDGNSRCIALGINGTAWTGEADGTITVRMAPLGYEIGKIDAYGRATVLTLLKSRGKMWAGYSDGAIRAFHLDNMSVLFESTKHTAAVHTLCEAGGFLYTGGADWKVYQWDADDYHYERMLAGHKNNVRCLVSYTDPETGKLRIASGSDDGTVRVWDPAQPTATACIAILETEKAVLSILSMQDSAEMWTGCEDGVIRIWDLETLNCTMAIQAQRAPIVTMRQVEDTIWTGAKNGTMVILNRLTKSVAHETSQPPSTTTSGPRFTMALMPVQRTLVHNVWATTADGQWQCWSCIYPESGVLGEEEEFDVVAGPQSVSRRSRRASSLAGTPAKARQAPRPAADDEDENLSPEEQERRERDRELRQSVARIRQSVVEQINESSMAAESYNDAEEVADDEDEDPAATVDINKIEKSIRRDREEDLQRSTTRSAPRSTTQSARREESGDRHQEALEEELRQAKEERDRMREEMEQRGASSGDANPMSPRVSELEAKLAEYERQQRINREALTSLSNDLNVARQQNEELQEKLDTARRELDDKEEEGEAAAEGDDQKEL